MSVVEFPGGKSKPVAGSEALRKFADLIEEFEIGGLEVEVAGVALIPDVGVALCSNSETGNDGLNTMLDIGKMNIIMQYMNEQEYDDEPTLH
jgi:hypothetical protein